MRWRIFGKATHACIQQLLHSHPPWNTVPSLRTKCYAGQTHSLLLSARNHTSFADALSYHPNPLTLFISFLISVHSNGFLSGIIIHLVSADPCSRVPSPNLVPSCQSPSSPTTSSSFFFLFTCILLSYFSEFLHLFLAHPKSPLRLSFSIYGPLYNLCQYTHI